MDDVIISSTCIRFYESGPEYHEDDQHATFGVINKAKQPYVDTAGYLVIPFQYDLGPRKVGAMHPSSDESLTKNGLWAGASNGGPYARLRFYKVGVGYLNLTNSTHYMYLVGDLFNLWFTATHLKLPAV